MPASLRSFPLFALPLAVFVLFALAGRHDWAEGVAFTLPMFSGALWQVTFGDVFLLLCLVVLFIEVVKASNTTASEILNHGLSMLVAIVCLVLFVTTRAFTNTPFFLLTVMTFFSVAAGLSITIIAARRDFGAPTH